MTNFKKGIIKVISVILTVAFLFNSTVYGINISTGTHLRKNLDFNNADNQEMSRRWDRALKEVFAARENPERTALFSRQVIEAETRLAEQHVSNAMVEGYGSMKDAVGEDSQKISSAKDERMLAAILEKQMKQRMEESISRLETISDSYRPLRDARIASIQEASKALSSDAQMVIGLQENIEKKKEAAILMMSIFHMLLIQDEADLRLPYVPHSIKHSLNVRNEVEQIIDNSETIQRDLAKAYGGLQNAKALALILAWLHDIGYGMLTEAMGQAEGLARNLEIDGYKSGKGYHAQLGVTFANTPLTREGKSILSELDSLLNLSTKKGNSVGSSSALDDVAIAIRDHGADKLSVRKDGLYGTGKHAYRPASTDTDVLSFLIRLADNLDADAYSRLYSHHNNPFFTNLLRNLQDAAVGAVSKGQKADFINEVKREFIAKRSIYEKAYALYLQSKEGIMLEAADQKAHDDFEIVIKNIESFDDSNFPHFAGMIKSHRVIEREGKLVIIVKLNTENKLVPQEVLDFQVQRMLEAYRSLSLGGEDIEIDIEQEKEGELSISEKARGNIERLESSIQGLPEDDPQRTLLAAILDYSKIHPEVVGALKNVEERKEIIEQEFLAQEKLGTQDAEKVYILLDGELEVWVKDPEGRDSLVATLDKPGLFGEMKILLGTRSATVRSKTRSSMIEMTSSQFKQILQYPQFTVAYAELVAKRDEKNRQRLAMEAGIEAVTWKDVEGMLRQGSEGSQLQVRKFKEAYKRLDWKKQPVSIETLYSDNPLFRRGNTAYAKIRKYASLNSVPSPIMVVIENGKYIVKDGFHRVVAAIVNKKQDITAFVAVDEESGGMQNKGWNLGQDLVTASESVDFGIASDNQGGVTRKRHEEFHGEGRLQEVIEDIAKEIGAEKKEDGFYDLRKVVNAQGGSITTSHGELRIEEDGALVIIDDRFLKDHAGRGQYAVYASTEQKARHELTELRLWKKFAIDEGIVNEQDIQKGKLGEKLREWMNDSGLSDLDKRGRETLIIARVNEFHKQGLEEEEKFIEERMEQKIEKILIEYIRKSKGSVSDRDMEDLKMAMQMRRGVVNRTTNNKGAIELYRTLVWKLFASAYPEKGYGTYTYSKIEPRLLAWDIMVMRGMEYKPEGDSYFGATHKLIGQLLGNLEKITGPSIIEEKIRLSVLSKHVKFVHGLYLENYKMKVASILKHLQEGQIITEEFIESMSVSTMPQQKNIFIVEINPGTAKTEQYILQGNHRVAALVTLYELGLIGDIELKVHKCEGGDKEKDLLTEAQEAYSVISRGPEETGKERLEAIAKQIAERMERKSIPEEEFLLSDIVGEDEVDFIIASDGGDANDMSRRRFMGMMGVVAAATAVPGIAFSQERTKEGIPISFEHLYGLSKKDGVKYIRGFHEAVKDGKAQPKVVEKFLKGVLRDAPLIWMRRESVGTLIKLGMLSFKEIDDMISGLPDEKVMISAANALGEKAIEFVSKDNKEEAGRIRDYLNSWMEKETITEVKISVTAALGLSKMTKGEGIDKEKDTKVREAMIITLGERAADFLSYGELAEADRIVDILNDLLDKETVHTIRISIARSLGRIYTRKSAASLDSIYTEKSAVSLMKIIDNNVGHPERMEAVSAVTNIGKIFIENGQYDAAKVVLDYFIGFRKKETDRYMAREIATALGDIAVAYVSKGDNEKEVNRIIDHLIRWAGEENLFDIKGKIFIALGKIHTDKTSAYLKNRIDEETGRNARKDIVLAIGNLAIIALSQGKQSEANEIIELLNNWKDNGSYKDIERFIYIALSRIHKEKLGIFSGTKSGGSIQQHDGVYYDLAKRETKAALDTLLERLDKGGDTKLITAIIYNMCGNNIFGLISNSRVPNIYAAKMKELAESGDRRVLNKLIQLLNTKGFGSHIYYSAADALLSLASNEKLPQKARDDALKAFKEDYKKALAGVRSNPGVNSPEVMAIVNRAIELKNTEEERKLYESLEGKYNRAPQRILFYLTMPEVVYPLVEAHRKMRALGQDISLEYLIGTAFAEGYIMLAKDMIAGLNKPNLVSGPMGMDRFGEVEARLKQEGKLPKDYDSFIRTGGDYTNENGDTFPAGFFNEKIGLLIAHAALVLQDRERFLQRVKRLGYDSTELTEDDIRVGTYLWYSSANPSQYLEKNRTGLVGKVTTKKHGSPMYNAQWPAATAEMIEKLFGDVINKSKERGSVDAVGKEKSRAIGIKEASVVTLGTERLLAKRKAKEERKSAIMSRRDFKIKTPFPKIGHFSESGNRRSVLGDEILGRARGMRTYNSSI